MIMINPKTLSGIITKWLQHGEKVKVKQCAVLFVCNSCGRAYSHDVWAKHFPKCVK